MKENNTVITQIIDFLEYKKHNKETKIFISPENWELLRQPVKEEVKSSPLPIKEEIKSPSQPVKNEVKSSPQQPLFIYDNYQDSPTMLIIVDPLNPKPLNKVQKELLGKMLNAINLSSQDVTILSFNTISKEKIEEEIKKFNTQLILIMGAKALKPLLQQSFMEAQNRWFKINNIDTIATYHPQFLINNPKYKKESWEVLKKVQKNIKEKNG